MRDEFRCKMREDIDLLGSLIDALDGLHEQAEAEEEGLELFPMMGVGRCIRSARTKCLAFDAYFEEKYGRKKSEE